MSAHDHPRDKSHDHSPDHLSDHSKNSKIFDRWNELKKSTDETSDDHRPYFREGEVWWVRLGKNVGYEIDGKSQQFTRPVVILKKYNQYSFLALPLTTNHHPSRYRILVGVIDGKQSFGTLSQLRNIDSKRLVKKLTHIPTDHLALIKKEASRVNFG